MSTEKWGHSVASSISYTHIHICATELDVLCGRYTLFGESEIYGLQQPTIGGSGGVLLQVSFCFIFCCLFLVLVLWVVGQREDGPISPFWAEPDRASWTKIRPTGVRLHIFPQAWVQCRVLVSLWAGCMSPWHCSMCAFKNTEGGLKYHWLSCYALCVKSTIEEIFSLSCFNNRDEGAAKLLPGLIISSEQQCGLTRSAKKTW